MRFSVKWVERAPNQAPEENATAAQLGIVLQDVCVTFHETAAENSSKLYMPTYPLVDAIVHGWWQIFGGRDRKFGLKPFRNGYAVPDLRMNFDGSMFEATVIPTKYKNPPVVFKYSVTEDMNCNDAFEALSGFIEQSLERLESCGIQGTAAALRWKRIMDSYADPDEKAFCLAAGAFGEDPYAIPDEASEIILKAATIFADEALIEFLAGAHRGKDWAVLLSWINEARVESDDRSLLSDLKPVAQVAERATPPQSGEKSWARGYRRARAARKALDLKETDRICSVEMLANYFGNSKFEQKRYVSGVRALRDDHEDGVRIHLSSSGTKGKYQENLFSFARGVGDVACFPEFCVAPINDLTFAYRQAAGRAFAAEFLAPIREVRNMLDDGYDYPTIAEAFAVSEHLIQRQIENYERIESACAA